MILANGTRVLKLSCSGYAMDDVAMHRVSARAQKNPS